MRGRPKMNNSIRGNQLTWGMHRRDRTLQEGIRRVTVQTKTICQSSHHQTSSNKKEQHILSNVDATGPVVRLRS